LEPNGSFYVEAFEPSVDDKRHDELIARLDALSREVAALRPQTAGD
jgi:NAD-dependent DNA ligase